MCNNNKEICDLTDSLEATVAPIWQEYLALVKPTASDLEKTLAKVEPYHVQYRALVAAVNSIECPCPPPAPVQAILIETTTEQVADLDQVLAELAPEYDVTVTTCDPDPGAYSI